MLLLTILAHRTVRAPPSRAAIVCSLRRLPNIDHGWHRLYDLRLGGYLDFKVYRSTTKSLPVRSQETRHRACNLEIVQCVPISFDRWPGTILGP